MMPKPQVWMLVVLLALFQNIPGEGSSGLSLRNAGDKPDEPYSELWSRGTAEEKRLFISGISVGMSLMKRYLLFNIPSDFGSADSSKGSDSAGVSRFVNGHYSEVSFLENNFTEENLMRAMDVLYAKPKNRDFSFQQMYLIAIGELKRLRQEGKLDSLGIKAP